MNRRTLIALMMLFLLGASSCSKPASQKSADPVFGNTKAQNRSAGQTSLQEQKAQVGADSAAAGAALAGPPDQSASLPDLPPLPSKLIKNADVELEVKKGQFSRALDRAESIVERFGGVVSRSSVSRNKGSLSSGDVTIRVPSDKFAQALSQLKKLGKLISEEQSGEDVTKQFVDLDARLRNAKAQEAFFLRLIDQSKTISDLLQVQQQLSAIQLQIEQIQGELQVLNDQTSFSTISAHIFEPGAAAPTPRRGLGHAWQQAVDGAKNVIAGVIVSLGYIVPLGLLVMLFVGAGRLFTSRRRRRDEPGQDPEPS